MGKNKRNNKHQQQQQQQKSSQPNEATSTTSTEKDKDTVAPATGKPSVDEHRLKANKIALEILEAVQRQPANPNEEWQQYVQLQQLLEQMIVYEKPLQREEFPTGEDNCSTQTRMDKLASFNAWAVAGGVKSSSVEIATFDGYQLGLRATRDLNAGEQVLSVPRQLIFSEEHLSEAQVFSYYPSLTNFHLAFALVIEKVRGAASNWKPYIDILPPRYNTVLYFTVEQMQLMRGTSAIAAALRQCRGIARQYASMYKCAYIQPDDSIMTAMSVLFTQYGLCYDLYRPTAAQFINA
ncbi:CG32732 [Drosophila busckii]|uniref:protein-histidine N-methyltransferase n=1 Tax=Drosophila busckii TaxID=30019 RepID=A0A0M4EK42_DROBS|nr:CG32732 [Drosophila busckii]